MYQLDLVSLFLLGLFGSAHCIGMCGPLILTIPTGGRMLFPHLLYNLGRITTYTMIGALFGFIGGGLVTLTGKSPLMLLNKLEIWISFFSALLLFWLGLVRLAVRREPRWMRGAMPGRLPGFATIRQSVIIDRSPAACYLFGVLMGLLPCGLSYGAFAVALAAGGPIRGGLTTLAFGFGTLPGLLLLGTAASGLVRKYRTRFELLAGIVMIIMAVSLVINGLSRL